MTPAMPTRRGAHAAPDDRPPSLLATLESILQGLEAWVGAFFTSLLCLTIGVPLLITAVGGPFMRDVEGKWWAVLSALAMLWLWFDAPHLYRTWSSAARGDRPLAPAVARRQPVLPILLRPVVGLWMLAHFAMGVMFAIMMEQMTPSGDDGGRTTGDAVFGAVLALFYTFAANGFLVSAVKALTGSDRWVGRVWSCRVVIDLALVGVGTLASFWPAARS
jgi:hypothetical protein